MEKIIYKGIEIELVNGYYIFYLNGRQYSNTNIHQTKRLITRDLKN